MTNIVAITLIAITTVTNNIVSLEVSGEVKHVTPVVVKTIAFEVDGQWHTNEVRVTNATVRMVWKPEPLKRHLKVCDQPPMPPGLK